MASVVTSSRPSEARERLLRTASGIFYAKGVHAVGVDEILTQASVTRATFYRHFPGKDDLIVEYLRTADAGIRAAVTEAIAQGKKPDSGVHALAKFVAGQIGTQGFRGCAFLNAAAEYPDRDDPIHRAILDHRAWFLETVAAQFAKVSTRGDDAAAQFVMLRDGAMADGCLNDPARVTKTFLRAVDGLLTAYRTSSA